MPEINFLGDTTVSPLIAIAKDFYTKDELDLIWEDLNFLNDKLQDPEKTGTAVDHNDRIMKNNKGLFLDKFYIDDRSKSNILNINRKVFEPKFNNILLGYNPIFRHVMKCDLDRTLISYYENSHYYEAHTDGSSLTILTYFFKEPKKFKNGSIKFADFNIQIEIENNMVIVFPGSYIHKVDKIFMEKKDMGKNLGRYCMAQFLGYSK